MLLLGGRAVSSFAMFPAGKIQSERDRLPSGKRSNPGSTIRITAALGASSEDAVAVVAARSGDEKKITLCPVATVGLLYTPMQALPGHAANARIYCG
ncbi:MAG: hypothetical protein AW07_01100 [Candidatus Accumulibacter sp. SK-11]|nr:MAG: hypothetical protein AW07_01100 [Candidatus Accumulibacter sp. SK-11]